MERLIIERGRSNQLTKEEKIKRKQILDDHGYDSKSKTIDDGSGGRIKVAFDRYGTQPANTSEDYISGKRAKDIERRDSLTNSRGTIRTANLPKKKNAEGKIIIDRERLRRINQRGKDAETLRERNRQADERDSNRRARQITLSDRNLKSDTDINHEKGHVNDAKKTREYTKTSGNRRAALNAFQDIDNQTRVDNNGKLQRNKMQMDVLSRQDKETRKEYFRNKGRRDIANDELATRVKDREASPKSKAYIDRKAEIHADLRSKRGTLNKHDRNAEEMMADGYMLAKSKDSSKDFYKVDKGKAKSGGTGKPGNSVLRKAAENVKASKANRDMKNREKVATNYAKGTDKSIYESVLLYIESQYEQGIIDKETYEEMTEKCFDNVYIKEDLDSAIDEFKGKCLELSEKITDLTYDGLSSWAKAYMNLCLKLSKGILKSYVKSGKLCIDLKKSQMKLKRIIRDYKSDLDFRNNESTIKSTLKDLIKDISI